MKKRKRAAILSLALSMALAMLTGCGGGAPYEVQVTDAAGSPVAGVMVQFCSDTECMVNRTDENGSAAFEAEPGNYTAHILKVPAGYEANKEELSLTAENRMASFSLRKEDAAAETQAAEESQAS